MSGILRPGERPVGPDYRMRPGETLTIRVDPRGGPNIRTVTAARGVVPAPTAREQWAAAVKTMARADRAIERRRQRETGHALAVRLGYL